MALRLRGATSGYIELKAPASAGDNTLTLPVNNGSANNFLKTDGSGNLSWSSVFAGTLTTTDTCQTGDLTVLNATPDLRLQDSDHTGNTTEHTIYFKDSTGANQMNFGSPSGEQHLRIKYNTTDLVKIETDGKVGIGTTSPDSKLHIQSADIRGHQNLLELKHPNTTTTGDGPALLFNGYYSSAEWKYAKISAGNSGSGYGANLKIYVHPADGTQGSNVVEALDITGDGSGADVKVTNGNLVIGTADHGIDFSATAGTGTSELLDDYEEGTFTPTNSIGLTITNNTTAHYTKIGRLVHIQLDITFSGSADTAQCAMIQSLPFTSMAGNVNEGAIQFVSNTADAKWDYDDDNTRIFIAASESRIDIKSITGGTTQTRAWAVGRRIRISMNYLAA